MRYVTEPAGESFDIAVYTTLDAGDRDHVAVSVKHPLAADITTGMLTTAYTAGTTGRPLDTDTIADVLATLLAPWGGGTSDRGLRTEVAAAYQAGKTTRSTSTPVKEQAA